MTSVKLHGILAREYGDSFMLNIGNPKNVLQAIDCNRAGFIKRIISLQKEGFIYDLLINRQRIIVGEEMEGFAHPETIDLVPVIAGSSGLEPLVAWVFTKLVFAAFAAGIAYALAPKPDEIEALEIEAAASKQSLIFSNTANIASQGTPVPVGYGRLKVGTQVIQATIKSYPQNTDPAYLLTDGEGGLGSAMIQSRFVANQFEGGDNDGGGNAHQG